MLNLPIKILKTIQIETAQATIDFDNIAARVAAWDAAVKVTSRHLVLIVNAASPDAVAKRAVEIELNGDSGANYNHQTVTGEAAVPDADRQDGLNALFEYPGGTDYPFAIPGTTYANAFGGGIILFPHAFNTTNHKVALALGGAVENYVSSVIGRWASVAAITSLALSLDTGNFAAGSTFHLGVIDERYLVEEIEDAAADFVPTFDNIPQGEGDLAVIGYARSDRAAVEDEVLHSFNDDGVAANYPAEELIGRGAVPTASQPQQEIAMVSGHPGAGNEFGALVVSYSQYIKANRHYFLSESGYHEATGPTAEIRLMSGRRLNIEPINKLHYEPNAGALFKAGSLFSLYRVPKRIIERIELTAPQAVITFDNIPQNFEALQLNTCVRSTVVAASDIIEQTLNNDGVAGSYNFQLLQGALALVQCVRTLGSLIIGAVIAGNTANPGEYTPVSIFFPGYAETDRHKHSIVNNGRVNSLDVRILSRRWLNTDAITRIDLALTTGPNFEVGSVFELEGILRREGLPPDEGMSVD